MSIDKDKTEGGSGGKRGHSNMDHWVTTEEIKESTKKHRRINEKNEIRTELNELNKLNKENKIMNKEALIKEWNTFLQIPFPEIDNVNLQFELTEIDTFSAGCITRYLDGKLDQECINILKQSLVDLSIHLNKIKGKEKSYFMLLHEIISNIKEHKGF